MYGGHCRIKLFAHSTWHQTRSLHRRKGGTFSVNVTGGNNCDYSAKSNVDWVHVTSGYEMTGNATVTFRVNVNSTITRTGTISIAGQTFTVNQSRQ